jgi:hypothetical protein
MESKPNVATADYLEQQIAAWRAHLKNSRTITAADGNELEDHLREQIGALGEQGLSDDEAFLVAVKRMGAIDALTREFAREHSERLWKQLVLSDDGLAGGRESSSPYGSRKMWVALALAVAAAVAIKIPALFGIAFDSDAGAAFYPLNIAFFTLTFIVAYFAWERPLAQASGLWLAATFAAAAVIVNLFPFRPAPVADTYVLTSLHLPIALWLGVGVAYVGGGWRGNERRMDFVRFTGELFIYFVLIGLGGGVLIGATAALFQAIGIDIERHIESWILPCGVAGAAVVATWLVEAKQSVIENMAPVLTRIFSPLFALMFLVFMVTMVSTGRGLDPAREILIVFDMLLVVVFGLLLYSISARDPVAAPGMLDWVQLTLVVTALIVDVMALWAVGSRISEFGFTPNRVAALGENIVLLINLVGSAVLYARFIRGRIAFTRLADWQTAYIYILAGWAAVVAFIFPLLFGFE